MYELKLDLSDYNFTKNEEQLFGGDDFDDKAEGAYDLILNYYVSTSWRSPGCTEPEIEIKSLEWKGGDIWNKLSDETKEAIEVAVYELLEEQAKEYQP